MLLTCLAWLCGYFVDDSLTTTSVENYSLWGIYLFCYHGNMIAKDCCGVRLIGFW